MAILPLFPRASRRQGAIHLLSRAWRDIRGYIVGRGPSWHLLKVARDGGTWLLESPREMGAPLPAKEPIHFTSTVLQSPVVSVKSLWLPPCSFATLTRLLRAQAERLWPRAPPAAEVTFAIWRASADGWGINLFAAPRKAVCEHCSAIAALGVQVDRCLPEAVALLAHFRARHPDVPRALLLLARRAYCAFLLIDGWEIEHQAVLSGSLWNFSAPSPDQRAAGRQIMAGLIERFASSAPQREMALPLYAPQIQFSWDWRHYCPTPQACCELESERGGDVVLAGLTAFTARHPLQHAHFTPTFAAGWWRQVRARLWDELQVIGLGVLGALLLIACAEHGRARSRALNVRALFASNAPQRARDIFSRETALFAPDQVLLALQWTLNWLEDLPQQGLQIESWSYRAASERGGAKLRVRARSATTSAAARFVERVRAQNCPYSHRLDDQSLEIEALLPHLGEAQREGSP